MPKSLLIAGARQKARGKHTATRTGWVPRSQAADATPKDDTPKAPPSDRVEDSTKYKNWAKVHGSGAASVLDFIIQDYLTSQRKLKEGSDFVQNWGGLGRTRVNYYLPKLNQAWFISGTQYVQPTNRAALGTTKLLIAARGLTPVILRETDILAKTKLTLDKALQGRG